MKKILFVDDELNIRRLISRILKSSYDVTVCENGKIALSLATENDFDLIISDVTMPELNGVQLVNQLRGAGVTTPVILMSGEDFGLTVTIQEMILSGTVYDYVAKPFSPEAIKDRIRKVIG